MAEKNDTGKRVLTLKRTFNAPRQLVWDAWTRPEHIALWWGPKGMKTRVVACDFRTGGKWKFIMTAPNGAEFPAEGVYTEIIEYEKIVSSADFAPVTYGVIITALFEDKGEKTGFIFSVTHPTDEYRAQQEKMGVMNGWGSNFDSLDTYLTTLTNNTKN